MWFGYGDKMESFRLMEKRLQFPRSVSKLFRNISDSVKIWLKFPFLEYHADEA